MNQEIVSFILNVYPNSLIIPFSISIREVLMELHYRGAAYEAPNTGVEFSEGEVIGQYRGAVLRAHRINKLAVQQRKPPMKYRGAWVR